MEKVNKLKQLKVGASVTEVSIDDNVVECRRYSVAEVSKESATFLVGGCEVALEEEQIRARYIFLGSFDEYQFIQERIEDLQTRLYIWRQRMARTAARIEYHICQRKDLPVGCTIVAKGGKRFRIEESPGCGGCALLGIEPSEQYADYGISCCTFRCHNRADGRETILATVKDGE